MACNLLPTSFIQAAGISARAKVNLHCLEQRSRDHMCPKVIKALTDIHAFQKWLQASGPVSCSSGVTGLLPPSGHL